MRVYLSSISNRVRQIIGLQLSVAAVETKNEYDLRFLSKLRVFLSSLCSPVRYPRSLGVIFGMVVLSVYMSENYNIPQIHPGTSKKSMSHLFQVEILWSPNFPLNRHLGMITEISWTE